jgi:hypothetical protein
MADTPTINWPGKSGTNYKYWIYPLGASLKAEGGNYIFAKEVRPGEWSPLYIGQTGDLNERFDNHHKADCIKKNGATHIHAHLNGNDDTRLAEEADLIARWDPSCNG